jgi:type IV secretory pathway TraG/TraD family ATPase VirD4
VVGVQSYAQLAKTYGHDGGREISSLLNTRFLFRTPDPDIAQWSAKNLGETTLEEVREGISYGANTLRDGVSIQKIEREKPVVPASEIMRLPDLSCYARLAGSYPIVQLQMAYVAREKLQIGFLPSALPSNDMRKEVEQMLDKHAPVLDLKNRSNPTAPAVVKHLSDAEQKEFETLFE